MADGTKASVDLSSVFRGFDKLGSPQLQESLSRTMAVAGAREFRDEAKRQVHTGEGSRSIAPGTLRAAIYVAFRDAESEGGFAKYRVSWNTRKAPHGHLVEFGHWQNYVVYQDEDGDWWTDVTQPLASPKWVAAQPFMRPAWHVAQSAAQAAMVQAGRERLPELIRSIV